MDLFIPNFHSALAVVINSSSNTLETNLKVTFSKTNTDAQSPLLRSFRPRLWLCRLQLWRSKMSPSCTQRGARQREALPVLPKEETEGVGKALNGMAFAAVMACWVNWNPCGVVGEVPWVSLKCPISASITGERCCLQWPGCTRGAGEEGGRTLAQESGDCTVSTGSTTAWPVSWSESCRHSEPLFLHPQISWD